MTTLPIPQTITRRVTNVERRSLICQRHTHHNGPVEIVTFTLDGILDCHIEKDGKTYNAKFGTTTHVNLTLGEIFKLLEELSA